MHRSARIIIQSPHHSLLAPPHITALPRVMICQSPLIRFPYKTKEMIMGPPSITANLSLIKMTAGHIERVNSTKLLGIHLDSNFSWQPHIEAILAKATQRLYFLKQLTRAGVPRSQLRLRHFYLTVIRPILEYASPV